MKQVLLLWMGLAMTQGVWADEPSVVQKVGESVKQGAEATERGLKQGAEATEHGLKTGGEATVRGVRKAGEWVGGKLQQGGEKLEKASK